MYIDLIAGSGPGWIWRRRRIFPLIFLSEIERGLKWPYPETLQNLAAALEVEAFELFKPGDGKTMPDEEKYIKRFSNDVVIAMEKSVKRSLAAIKRQYGV
jgi:transcriptional regulator with XRE-family HTH domain